jgi:hypothetical protein
MRVDHVRVEHVRVHRPRRFDRRRALSLVGVALALAVVASLLFAPRSARAGTYVSVQCEATYNPAAPDAVFTRTSDHYVSGRACSGGAGLLINNNADSTKSGRWATWSWYPPPGTVFTQIASQSHVAHDAGHKGSFTIIDGSGTVHHRWPREGVFDAVDWTAGTDARAFSSQLGCYGTAGGDCGRTGSAHAHVRSLWFTFRDSVNPVLSLSGSIFEPGPKRGVHDLAASASDVGGGVWRWRVAVNGSPAGSREQSCDIVPGSAARRFVPCPLSAAQSFALDTSAAPFVPGANDVRVCVSDVGWPANEVCHSRNIHVESPCESSGTGPASELSAGFGQGRAAARAASNRRVKVSGRLRGAGPGARICVLATPSRTGAAEYPEGEVRPDAGGRFTYLVPRGPSRALRFVHRHDRSLAERELRLGVHARPRLKAGPRSRLRNGQTVRFRGKLPGPHAEGRVVVLQARVGNRWQAFKSARTAAEGRFRARYRFRETSGRRLYMFRAIVRAQAGYPYLGGSSPVRWIVVTG